MEETKKKKPIYKKWWFWVVIGVVVVAIIIGASLPDNNDDESPSALEKFDLQLARNDWSDMLDYGISNQLSLTQWDSKVKAYKSNASTPSITVSVSGGDSIGNGAEVGDKGTRTYTVTGKIGKNNYEIGKLVLLIRCVEVKYSGDIVVDLDWIGEGANDGKIGYGVEIAEVNRAFPWETQTN